MRIALLGENVSQSLSPDIHSCFGSYSYDALSVDESETERLLLSHEYDGFNVTIPYKRLAASFCDYLSPEAKDVGAVNTVIYRDGKLCGYNTDVIGLQYSLSLRGIDLTEKRVLILGTGATSCTAEYVVNISGGTVIGKVSRLGKLNYDNMSQLSPQVIINTTPIGAYPHEDEKLGILDKFPNLEGYAEVSYNPLLGAEIIDLKSKIKAADGLPMLVSQAMASAELFCGIPYSENVVREITEKLYQQRRNIVLVGMPGSGKTTIGRRIAELTGMKFVDTDEEIMKEEDATPETIILQRGIEVFRDIEKRVIRRIGNTEHNAVIATGGGTVLDTSNVTELKHFGLVFYVKRAVEYLATEGRPLSRGDLHELLNQRETQYLSCADAVADNTDVDLCASEIATEYDAMLKKGKL